MTIERRVPPQPHRHRGGRRAFTDAQVIKYRHEYFGEEEGRAATTMAREAGVAAPTMYSMLNGNTYADVVDGIVIVEVEEQTNG